MHRAIRVTLILFALAGAGRADAADETIPTEASGPTEAAGTDVPLEGAESYAETMVVTASRTEQSLLDVPVATSVITAEQIETSPAENYADLLRGIPGLNVVQTSARDINIVARGPASTMATSQLAMVDGRSVYQDFFGFVMWDLLPVNFDEIKQIEVLRGPGSAMWGANALGGVVNVRTKSPRETPGGLISVGGGNVGTWSGSARWGQAFKRASYRVAASYYEQDPWPRNMELPDGTPLPPEADFVNEGARQPKLDLRLDWDVDENTRWSYKLGVARTTGIMHSGIGPFTIDKDTGLSYGEVSYDRPMLNARIYLNFIDGDATNLLNLLPFSFKAKTWVADLGGSHPLNARHLLVYGGTARLNQFDLSLAPGEDTRREMGVYVEDQAEIGKVLLSMGLRADWYDTIGVTGSPRLSAVWRVRERQSLRFAYSRAFRSPSLINNYLYTVVPNQAEITPGDPPFVFPTYATGSEDLAAEIMDAFEIGWTAELGQSTFTAAVYRNITKDTIDFYPSEYYSPADPPPGWPQDPSLVPEDWLAKTYAYRNVGKTRSQGLELSLNTTWKPWLMTVASATWQDDNIALEDDPVEPLNLNQPPSFSASFAATFIGRRWKGQASASTTGEAYWTDVLDQRFYGWTNSYVLINGGVSWSKDPMSFELAATNILDEEVQQHVFGDIIGRKITATAKVTW